MTMAADDIHSSNATLRSATDALEFQGPAAHVSAQALERWARAATTPPALIEQGASKYADQMKFEPYPLASTKPEAASNRLVAAGTELAASGAPIHGQSALSWSGLQDMVSSPMARAQPPSRSDIFHAQALTAENCLPPAFQVPPSFVPTSQSMAEQRATDSRLGRSIEVLTASSAQSTTASRNSITTPVQQDGEPAIHGAFNGNAAPVRDCLTVNESKGEGSSRGDEVMPEAKAVSKTQTTSVQPNTQSARSLPLSALRGVHDNHRLGQMQVGSSEGPRTVPSHKQDNKLTAPADGAVPLVHALALPQSGPATNDLSAAEVANGDEQLHALIESCCSRLWVSDGASRVPQGVMLDLGRWMPGCTVEVAKVAGVLRITLRGVEGSERARLEDELQDLGHGLADKLGCKVVASVATNKELT
jgi:hypothetical protein